jgi:triphosphoribosyl-dephospho-CoA synthase
MLNNSSLPLSSEFRTIVRANEFATSNSLRLADFAVAVLIEEAVLTPKPALVDTRGSGAHSDLDLGKLIRSARALHSAFFEMAMHSEARVPDQELREELAILGRSGEVQMLRATGGSNAHRGAIWVLGLLIAGSASAGADATPYEMVRAAADIAAWPDRGAPIEESNGMRASKRYGVSGARGEAVAGFPHVIDVGLPALWAARARKVPEDSARLDALMAIMMTLDDTCLLHRGGLNALESARQGAREVLAAGGSSTRGGRVALLALDARLKGLNASPGGCADLLVACLFIDRLTSQF